MLCEGKKGKGETEERYILAKVYGNRDAFSFFAEFIGCKTTVIKVGEYINFTSMENAILSPLNLCNSIYGKFLQKRNNTLPFLLSH